MKIEDFLGDSKTISEGLKQFGRDALYFDKNYDNLRISFPDEWVAIYNQEIIAHSKNYSELNKKSRKYLHKYGPFKRANLDISCLINTLFFTTIIYL